MNMVITSSPLNSYTTDMKTWVVTHLTQNPQLCYPANVLFRNKKNTQLSKIVDLVKKKWILPPQQQHQHSTQPHFAINKVGEKSSSHQKATPSFHNVQTRHKQEALNGKERATRPQQLGVFVSCLTGWDFFFLKKRETSFKGWNTSEDQEEEQQDQLKFLADPIKVLHTVHIQKGLLHFINKKSVATVRPY